MLVSTSLFFFPFFFLAHVSCLELHKLTIKKRNTIEKLYYTKSVHIFVGKINGNDNQLRS